MMSIGDSMLSPAERLDKKPAQVKLPAMATPMACGNTMINKTRIIQANRTARLLNAINTKQVQQKGCHSPRQWLPIGT
jgi:hypothetical protein